MQLMLLAAVVAIGVESGDDFEVGIFAQYIGAVAVISAAVFMLPTV